MLSLKFSLIALSGFICTPLELCDIIYGELTNQNSDIFRNRDKNKQDDRNVEDFGGYSMQFITARSNFLLWIFRSLQFNNYYSRYYWHIYYKYLKNTKTYHSVKLRR